jgi:glycosyltransferase involved in cell wall biosynthesis
MKQHKRLEKKVVEHADLVITASEGIARSLPGERQKFRTLTNGIDPLSLKTAAASQPREGKFIIQYAGLLNDRRNPELLWEGLEALCRENGEFHQQLELRIAGQLGQGVLDAIRSKPLLSQKLVVQGYLPQKEVASMLLQASVLLLLIDNEAAASLIIPAKLFEYLAAQRPILYIGDPHNDAGAILQKERAGKGYAFTDATGPKAFVQECYLQHASGAAAPLKTPLEPYLRSTQARQLAGWLDALVPAPSSEL